MKKYTSPYHDEFSKDRDKPALSLVEHTLNNDRKFYSLCYLCAMDIKNNILETIGHTPLIRLNKITKTLPCTVLAKVEYFNPGNSIKDRMAIKMLEVAEKEGKIKPGGTIIEGTSGNTGMGLALAACVKGYKCIFTTTDKQSK